MQLTSTARILVVGLTRAARILVVGLTSAARILVVGLTSAARILVVGLDEKLTERFKRGVLAREAGRCVRSQHGVLRANARLKG